MIITDRKISKKSVDDCIAVLIKSFADDKLFMKMFSHETELSAYIALLVNFCNENGEVHTARVDGKIVAVALWNPPGIKAMNLWNLSKTISLHSVLHFMSLITLKTFRRINKEFSITERHHYTKEHYYLCLIGSQYKGAGTALMRFAMEKFSGTPLYLENSSIEENHFFYNKLGFKLLKRIDDLGVPIELLVADNKSLEIEEKTEENEKNY